MMDYTRQELMEDMRQVFEQVDDKMLWDIHHTARLLGEVLSRRVSPADQTGPLLDVLGLLRDLTNPAQAENP